MPEHHPWGLLTCAVPTRGMETAVGTRAPQPHLLCHPLQLLPDVGDEEAVEALFISPSLDQPAGVVLQEGKRGHLPVAAGYAGLGTGGCRGPGTHQAVLMDAEPILTAELPNHLGVTVCPPAQPTHYRGTAALSPPALCQGANRGNTGSGMGERPEHLPMAQAPLLAQPGTSQNPLWQVPGGMLSAHLPPQGPLPSFWAGEAHRRVLPPPPAALLESEQGGAAASHGKRATEVEAVARGNLYSPGCLFVTWHRTCRAVIVTTRVPACRLQAATQILLDPKRPISAETGDLEEVGGFISGPVSVARRHTETWQGWAGRGRTGLPGGVRC